jgi:methionyl-tRNA formyltransferase
MQNNPAGFTSPSLAIVFFGTSSDYSLKPLQRISAEHNLVAIVESGDRGCKRKSLAIFQKVFELFKVLLGKPSLWVTSLRLKIPYYYLCKGNEDSLIAFMQPLAPDAGCMASFNQLLPCKVIHIPPLGIINFHPSLLPKYRGADVWFWLYHEMEIESGATIHFIDDGEDTGDLLKQASFPIPPGMELNLLRKITINLGTELLSETLKELAKGSLSPIPQRHLTGLPRARLLKNHGDFFDWQNWSLQQTFHFLHGLLPVYSIFSNRQGFWGRFRWTAYQYEPQGKISAHGLIRLDARGFYFAHPEGKIRLRLAISMFQIVLIVLAALVFLFSIIL